MIDEVRDTYAAVLPSGAAFAGGSPLRDVLSVSPAHSSPVLQGSAATSSDSPSTTSVSAYGLSQCIRSGASRRLCATSVSKWPSMPGSGTSPIGIDLGLKEIRRIGENPRWYRRVQSKIAGFSTGRSSDSADSLHKFSRGVVDRASAIYIGDVRPTVVGRTRLAKSVQPFKTMLIYKGQQAGIAVEIVPSQRGYLRARIIDRRSDAVSAGCCSSGTPR